MDRWTVKWKTGREKTFVPYDSLGYTSFVKQGLKLGRVTVNDRPVTVNSQGYVIFVDD